MKTESNKAALLRRILLLEIAFVVYTAASVFSKLAAGQAFLSPLFMLYGVLLVGSLGVYALMWQQVLRHFSLITAMANKGIVVIWTLLASVAIFQEVVTWENIAGGALIIIGIVVVSKGES